MKLGRLLIIVFAIILYQSILNHDCYAANWQYVTAWKNKMLHYIDTDSIQVNLKNEQITFFTKAVAPSGYYYTSLILCNYAEKYYKPLKIIEYDNNGNVIKSTSYDPAKSEKKLISIESVMEIILNEALSIKGIKSP